MAGRFREPNVPRNDRVEHLPGKVAIHLVADLERETRPTIEHREHDAFDVQARVEALSYELDGLEKVGQTFERVELTLKWDENSIGGHKGVDGEKAQGGWTVDDDVVVGACDRL